METKDQKNLSQVMDKQGLRLYAAFAGTVYLAALAYCFYTDRIFEAGMVGAVMLGLGILIGYKYNSK